MFNQFRHAVESLGQPPPRQSLDSPSSPDFRSLSPDPLRQNLRRPSAGIPRPRSASPGPLSSPKGTTDSGLRRTTLEERLRASFVASDVSGATPSTDTSPAPSYVPVAQHPLSPASTPLPDSPILAASTTALDLEPPILPEDATKDAADTLVLNDVAPPPAQPPTGTNHASQAPEISTREECLPDTTLTDQQQESSVEALQERLKLVEQRFADVSTSFKQLQVERRDMDGVICELTPLSGSKDLEALREYLTNVNMKVELGQDELQRLNGKLTRQEERLEELRDSHRLETASQSNHVEKLRQQLNEAEALISASQTEEANAKRDVGFEQLRTELAKANESAKEEEEKRVKAISLLKTVRQKLVKAEKERDDALRDLNETRDRSSEEKEKDRAERAKLERELSTTNMEREKVVTGLRAQFDKDISIARDHAERDAQAAKKQFDAEMSALKTSYNVDISAKKSRISTLENTVAILTNENKSFFEQMELRQAEHESSQYHAESLQAQNTELQFRLKELQERLTLLDDEVSELRVEHEMQTQNHGASVEEVSQLISSIETSEAKLSNLKKTLAIAEKERTEAEANWSRKLTEKANETEELKRMLKSSAQLRERDEDITGSLKAEIDKLQIEARSQYARIHELQTNIDAVKDAESTLHRRLSEAAARAEDKEKQFDESKSRETQLRTQNKTLRDELRKVQSSVAVLERQRHPGIGFWASRSEVAASRPSVISVTDPLPSSPPPARNEEEINHEYLRNVILQFLEHKEMRPNLVRVLSTILHFTPQETRRLMSRV